MRDALYNSEAVEGLERLYRQALDCLGQAGLPPSAGNYWRSRIEYLLGRGYQAARRKPEAEYHFGQGLACLESIQAGADDSEGWRMRSELLGHLCLVKDMGFLLKNAGKATYCAEKALKLNPQNAGAQIILAAKKIYPPAILGGNPRAGIELMQKALAMGTAESDDLFNIYSGLGLAYSKLKRKEEAQRWFTKALELYPGNLFARTEREKLFE